MASIFDFRKEKIVRTSADKWFSIYIRIRDSFLHNNEYFVKCVTCGKFKKWCNMQCGHMVSRRKNATRFNEINCHPQCSTCNGRNKGEQGLHVIYIDKRYGQGAAEMIFSLSKQKVRKFSHKDLKYLSDMYRKKAYEVAGQKGINLKKELYLYDSKMKKG